MSGDRGTLVWRVLFGVVMAVLLLAVFFFYLESQRTFEVGASAQALANELSHTVFLALTGQQPTYELPESVGGAGYELDVEGGTFIVRITGGAQRGNEYRSASCADLEVDSIPEPGGTLYAQGAESGVTISAESIEAPAWELEASEAVSPTDFYYFARENQREASAIVASYFYARGLYSDENLDIRSYKWEGEGTLLARVTSGGKFLTTIRAAAYEDQDNVGLIDNSWIVSQLENITGDITENLPCPSVENSASSGRIYAPAQMLSHLRSRTWRLEDNTVIAVPEEVSWFGAAVTTNVSDYPTWRFEFSIGENLFVGHLNMIPWWPDENVPGFVFQSEPELEAVT